MAARVTTHIDIPVSDDVLLEIFDAYLQIYELQLNYLCLWSSRDGWFKLAHVCLRWRRVVFSASSRLHLCLLYTPRRSSRDPVLRCLPRFPIFANYHSVKSWTKKEEKLVLAAIRDPGHVRGITLERPFPETVHLALSRHFPILESLTIYSMSTLDEVSLPPTFLSGSAPCLRQLTLQDISLGCLSSLLSSATGLTDVSLTLRIARRGPRDASLRGPRDASLCGPPDASLLTNLQRMSCLRRLKLGFIHGFSSFAIEIPICSPLPLPACAEEVVSLSKLTDFIFVGPGSYLQMLVAGLAAPSLQYLDAIVDDNPPRSYIPHLCKFICDKECQFIKVRLDIWQWRLRFSADTWSKSDRAQPFGVTIPTPVSLQQIGNIFSEPLSTVEEFAIGWDEIFPSELARGHKQWRELFGHIPRTKIIQVSSQAALNVADSFRIGGQGPILDILPALEQVKVCFPVGWQDWRCAPTYDAFNLLVSAREKVGRSIVVSRA